MNRIWKSNNTEYRTIRCLLIAMLAATPGLAQKEVACTTNPYQGESQPPSDWSIDQVNPSGYTAWIQENQSQVWDPGDTFLIRRQESVLASGSVLMVSNTQVLLRFRPIPLTNTTVQKGDTVERITHSDRTGSECNTRILAVDNKLSPGGLPQVLLAMGGSRDIAPGMRFDITRNGEYIGFCRANEISEIGAVAEIEPSLSKTKAAPGDQVTLRNPDSPMNTGRIFRVVDRIALISLGSLDSINLGDKLRLANRNAPPLIVTRINNDHCEVHLPKGIQDCLWEPVLCRRTDNWIEQDNTESNTTGLTNQQSEPVPDVAAP